jgi:endoglucanase
MSDTLTTTIDDFIFSAWGRTTWGSPEDKQTLSTELSLIRSNFTDVPLIIGEWAASPVATETAARWKYFDFFVRTAAQYNTTTVLWDNGADFLNRATHGWRDNTALDILRAVVKGEKNSLPESTTDGSATEQESSAYLYHKSGTNVSDTPLKFQFNGNRLQSAKLTKTGKELEKGTDYLVEEAKETVTFKSSFLSTILTPATAPGSVANITLVFSSGAPLLVNILQYSTPVLATSTSKLPAAPTALSDLHIPITWAGQNRPATVKAVKSDGKFLVDDWTQWLGPLQQGRMTYGGQWDWDGAGVIVKAAALEEVRRAGLETVFRIEFYPRREGNWVEYTVSV